MTIDTKDMLNSILASISRIDYIKPDDVPNIDLYMDQVTTFMDAQLAASKRYEDDKVLTKTMINNYTKNNLLPPPVKKKYSTVLQQRMFDFSLKPLYFLGFRLFYFLIFDIFLLRFMAFCGIIKRNR